MTVSCPHCDGYGERGHHPRNRDPQATRYERCAHCHGTGRLPVPTLTGEDFPAFLYWLALEYDMGGADIAGVVDKPHRWAPEYAQFSAGREVPA